MVDINSLHCAIVCIASNVLHLHEKRKIEWFRIEREVKGVIQMCKRICNYIAIHRTAQKATYEIKVSRSLRCFFRSWQMLISGEHGDFWRRSGALK